MSTPSTASIARGRREWDKAMSALVNATRRALFRRFGLGALSAPAAGAMLKRAVGGEASGNVKGNLVQAGTGGVPVNFSTADLDREFLRHLVRDRDSLSDKHYAQDSHRRILAQEHYNALISVSSTGRRVLARRHEQAERERTRSWAESLLRTLPFMKEGDL